MTDDGRAVFDIAVDAPPGVAGLRPGIGLHSEPGAGDGLLGIGWSLTGLSEVRRCPQGHALAGGFPQPVGDEFGRPDGLCLSGRPLVRTQGDEFRTEVDSFHRVVAHGTAGAAGPQGFEVWGKDGRIMRYGFTDNALLTAGGRRHRWLLQEIRDQSGNHIDVEYRQECPEPGKPCDDPVPYQLSYGGHRGPSGETRHDRWVRFGFEPRPDTLTSFSTPGQLSRRTQRMTSIDTAVDGRPTRRLRIDYAKGAGTSRIDKVRECTEDAAAEVCKPGTSFRYRDAGVFAGEAVKGPAVPWWFNWDNPRYDNPIVLDANGDGRDDVLNPVNERDYTFCPATLDTKCWANPRWTLALATGRRDAPFTVSTVAVANAHPTDGRPPKLTCLSQAAVFDYDGDGRDDLLNTCGGGTDYIQVFVATDKGFQGVEVDAAGTTKYPLWVWPADLNGDSLTDLVVCGGDKTRTPFIRFGRGPGKGFEPARTLPILFPLGENGYPPSWAACDRQPAFVDVDGDGVTNLLVSIRKGDRKAADFQESWKSLTIGPNAAVWKDTGLVFDGPQEHTGNGDLPVAVNHDVPLAGQHQLRFLDANGDRLQDALRFDDGLVTLRLNTGRGFGPATRVLGKRPDWAWHELSAYSFRRAVTRDLDRDGRDDLLLPYGRADQPNRLRWVLYSARGAGFEPAEAAQWSLAYRVSPLTADVDGDDSPDLITAVDEPGLRDGPGEGLRMVVRYGDNARGNLLTSVLDGVGRSVIFDYSAAVDGERVYRRTADCKTRQSWCRARVGPLVGAVTVQVAERDGPVGVDDTVWRRVRRTTFRYEDARVGWYGRGSLGVGRRVEQSFGATDVERGDTITRRYGNDVFHDTEPNTTIRQWYPFHEQVLEQTTESAPVRQGLTDPRSERQTVTDVSRPEVRISAAGRPFVTVPSTEQTTTMAPVDGGSSRRVSGVSTTVAVNADGNPTSTVVKHQNGRGEPVEQIETTVEYDASAALRARWLLDRPRLHTVRHRRAGAASQRVTLSTWDDRGLSDVTTREPDDPARRLVTDTDHDEFGNVTLTAVGERGAPAEKQRRDETRYDDRGLLPIRTVNAAGHVSTVRGDPVTGQPLVAVDPNGVVRRYAYDGFGRVVRDRGPLGDTVTRYTRVDNDDQGDPRARTRTTVVAPGGATTTSDADSLGRAVVVGRDGYAGARMLTETSYDWADRPLEVSLPHGPADKPEGSSWQVYDALGRVTAHSRSDSTVTKFRYASPDELPSAPKWRPNVRTAAATAVAVIDPLSRRQVEVRDDTGAPVARVDGDAVTQLEYGGFGALESIIDPGGAVTRFSPDQYGRVDTVESPATGRHSYTYTTFDEVLTHTDPEQRSTTYGYDKLGRTVSRLDARGAASWHYDGPGPNAIGKLTEAAGPQGELTRYFYEPVTAPRPCGPADPAICTAANRGLPDAEERVIGGNTYRTEFDQDDAGRLSRVRYPASAGRGFEVEYGYDTAGNPTEVRDHATKQPYWTYVGTDRGDRITDERFGNGVRVRSDFEPVSGHREGIEVKRDKTRLQGLTYRYDDAGNLLGVDDRVRGERSRSYVPDGLNRAWQAKADDKVVEEFGFGDDGSITAQRGIGDYRYARPHVVRTAGANSYEHDAAGNQTLRTGPDVAGGVQRIAYTPANLPSRIETGADRAVTEFDYDADERRVVRRTPEAVTEYLPGYERRRDRASGSVEHRYSVSVGGRVVAQVVRAEPATGPAAAERVYYGHADNSGSLLDGSDAAGGSAYRQNFGMFGAPVELAAAEATGERGYGGRRQDAGTGLIDLGGRFYDPKLGRFISADPALTALVGVGSPQGGLVDRIRAGSQSAMKPGLPAADLLEPYSYAGNNPLTWSDPTGFAPDDGDGGPAVLYEEWARDFWQGLQDTISGFGWGLAEGVLPSGAINHLVLDLAWGLGKPTQNFQFGRGVGQMLSGGLMAAGGPPTAAGGLVLTGGGVVPAVGLVAAGEYMTVVGVTNVGMGFNLMLQSTLNAGKRDTGGGPAGSDGSGEKSSGTPNTGNGSLEAGELGNLRPIHGTNPGQAAELRKLSDDELLRSFNNPADGGAVLVTKDGTIMNGHHRIEELQRRMNDPDSAITPWTRVRIDQYQRELPSDGFWY
ncbi:RHS repeat-associated core domain-containing protein [Actinoplanes sp. NPDC049668]|uniref:RHS repeat-associated core domain-containing protein n=1 Tax=unclassified Actinoplanes TaxID=2626549 RepID=UPI0033AF7C19